MEMAFYRDESGFYILRSLEEEDSEGWTHHARLLMSDVYFTYILVTFNYSYIFIFLYFIYFYNVIFTPVYFLWYMVMLEIC